MAGEGLAMPLSEMTVEKQEETSVKEVKGFLDSEKPKNEKIQEETDDVDSKD